MPGQTISGGERTWRVRKAVPEDAPKVNIYFENLKAEGLPWFSGFTESAEACSEFIERSPAGPRSLPSSRRRGRHGCGRFPQFRIRARFHVPIRLRSPTCERPKHIPAQGARRCAYDVVARVGEIGGGLQELTAAVHAKNEGAQRFLCRFKFREETLPGGSPEYRHFVLELNGPVAEEAV